ncbi:MAG TPA: hypothetical protein VGM81_13255 [Burkholderiaceae bacterium]|jgi:hypothetical protein
MTTQTGNSWALLLLQFQTLMSARGRLEKAGNLPAAGKVSDLIKATAVAVIAGACLDDRGRLRVSEDVGKGVSDLLHTLEQARADGDQLAVSAIEKVLVETALNSVESRRMLAKMDASKATTTAPAAAEAKESRASGAVEPAATEQLTATIIKAMTEAIKAMPAPVVNLGDTYVEVGDSTVHAHFPGRIAKRIVGERLPDGSLLATVVDEAPLGGPGRSAGTARAGEPEAQTAA